MSVIAATVATLTTRRDEIVAELREINTALKALTGEEPKGLIPSPDSSGKVFVAKTRGRGVKPSETTRARVRSYLMSRGNAPTHFREIQEALAEDRRPSTIYMCLTRNGMFERTSWGEYRVRPEFTTEP